MPSLTSSPTLVAVTQPKNAAPAYSATPTPDASAGSWHTITVTNASAFQIKNPTNPPGASRSQELTIEIFNNTAGGIATPTWDTAYVFGTGAFTSPGAGKKRFMQFVWNGTKWASTITGGVDY